MMGVLALAVLVAALAAAGTAGAASTSHGGGGGGNVTYRVNGDTIVHKRNAVKPAHARLWQRFATLIPAEQRTELRKFIVFKGGFSDAFVGPLRRDPKLWELGVNRSLLGDRELDVVLLHEFGHLLTLTADQIPPGSRGRRCGTYRTGRRMREPAELHRPVCGRAIEAERNSGRLAALSANPQRAALRESRAKVLPQPPRRVPHPVFGDQLGRGHGRSVCLVRSERHTEARGRGRRETPLLRALPRAHAAPR